MKQHFCPAEQSMIAFEKECNWCGEREGSMTQDEIIEMAEQAEFCISPIDSVLLPKLEAFAKLVAAKEREAMLDLVDSYAKNNTDLADAIRARGQA
jgi:EAL domain-containing protein (putative c-di-GMP-specific phosphodiesterase class I)